MATFEGTHALIVEDTYTDAEVLKFLLDRLGMSYLAVSQVSEVNDALAQASRLDVIFLDLELPDGSGYQVLEAFQATPEMADIPIVAYTSHNSEMATARAKGFHSFLGKPLKQDHFPGQLGKILNNEAVWEVR